MARLPRLYVPGLPQLLVQRGNNRQLIFSDDADNRFFLDCLHDAAREHGLAVHAFVLMPDHFHLLATPPDQGSLSRALQSVGRRYVAYFNHRVGRSGTLWEGRYRSTVLDPQRFLLAAMRYIELNPVRAGMLQDATRYPWSSCAHHVGVAQDSRITDHAAYWALANTPFERQALYRQQLEEMASVSQWEQIRAAVHKGWMLADAATANEYEGQASRRLLIARRGRPRSSI